MKKRSRYGIKVQFSCKLCTTSYFKTVEDYIEHKKEDHFIEFRKTKCFIILEEKNSSVDVDNNSYDDDGDGSTVDLNLNVDVESHRLPGRPRATHFIPPDKVANERDDKDEDLVNHLLNLLPTKKKKNNGTLTLLNETTLPLTKVGSPNYNSKNPHPPRSDLHFNEAHNPKFQCKLCLRLFNSEPALTIHGNICILYHPNRDSYCALCNNLFLNSETLKNHMSTFHSTSKIEAPPKKGGNGRGEGEEDTINASEPLSIKNSGDLPSSPLVENETYKPLNECGILSTKYPTHVNQNQNLVENNAFNPRNVHNNFCDGINSPSPAELSYLLPKSELVVFEAPIRQDEDEINIKTETETDPHVIRFNQTQNPSPLPSLNDPAVPFNVNVIHPLTDFQCKLCVTKFNSEPALKIHGSMCALYHPNRNSYCSQCDKLFCSGNMLTRHRRNCHSNTTSASKSVETENSSSSRVFSKLEQQAHGSDETEFILGDDNNNDDSLLEIPKSPSSPSPPTKMKPNQKVASKQINQINGVSYPPDPDPVVTFNQTQNSPLNDATVPFNINVNHRSTDLECKLCLKKCNSEPELKIHKKMCELYHPNRNSYCSQCNKLFSSGFMLNRHRFNFHSKTTSASKSVENVKFIHIDNGNKEDSLQEISTSTSSSSSSPPLPKKMKPNHQKLGPTQINEIYGVSYPKPAFSYIDLIWLALKNSKTGRLHTTQILRFVAHHFPYFKSAKTPTAWTWTKTKALRHSLLTNKCFLKKLEVGAGRDWLWALDPSSIQKRDMKIQYQLTTNRENIRNAMRAPENLEQMQRGELIEDFVEDSEDDDYEET